MDRKEYKKMVLKHTPKEPRLRNIVVAFFVGGIIGFISEFIIFLFNNCSCITEGDAKIWASLIIIFLSCLFTGLGFFDEWVSKCKFGLILPTTGFAHSIASSAIDYRKDGLITGLGSNFFKLAGSVILYGIIGSFILVIVKVIIGV